VTKRRTAICFHATKPGKHHQKKPRVAEVFDEENHDMGDHMFGRKKRRREDELDQNISALTKQSPSSK
jgi:hypothetical protein